MKFINSLMNVGTVHEEDEEGGILTQSTPDLYKQDNNKSRNYSISSNISNKSNKSNRSIKSNRSSKSGGDAATNKICIGDKIKITTVNKKTKKKLKHVKGIVMYIGYPYVGRGIRYGINLEKAVGENDGALMIDIKTGKLAKESHIEKYKKRIKKRKFFKAKTKHGIFVKKDEIVHIDRFSTLSMRFTINDDVQVRFRGVGKIKFVGNLEHTEMGVWYGIHLTERRGRHDGTVNGVKYFECPPQYGLHCRQNHLTLIHDETKETEETKSDPEDDEHPSNLYINSSSRPRAHAHIKNPHATTKPQKSVKWAKLLGVTDASKIKGFTPTKKGKSTMNLMLPKFQKTESESQPDSPDTPLRLKSISSNRQSLNKMISISNIIPKDAFRPALSVHVLPGIHEKNKKDTQAVDEHSKHKSIQGKTTVVLPGYHEKIKKRKFFEHFDFDEIEDELGEGEFGVVYKCRKIQVEDDMEYSTTFHTEMTRTGTMYKMKMTSMTYTDTGQFPGGDDSERSYSQSSDDDDEIYAVKKIKKAKFHHLTYQAKQDAIKLLQQEIKLLEKIQRYKQRKLPGSNYVIDLVDVFEDRNYLYIVTNFCAGGNLWKYIEDEDEQVHSEQRIQSVMKQILEGLVFLHNNNLAHLDIKPDNIMFTEDGEIQLIDFGMSRVIPPLIKARVLVGTPNFVAPEVIEGFYDKKADIWSVGVIFFMLRFGYPPFFEGNEKVNVSTLHGGVSNLGAHNELFAKILNGFDPVVKSGLGAWFPAEVAVSEELQDLLTKMLDSDLGNRYTAAECLAHPYFETLADAKKLPLTVMNAFSKFSGQCQFKVMIARLFAHQIEPKQKKQLQETWNKFDVDNDGSLTLEQFKSVMRSYDHGYRDYQIEAIFASLDWNETETINFDSLLTAFSYQRLVAVDERLWEAFARLDVDNDGHITKAEIKRCLAMVNPEAFDEGIKKLDDFQAENDTALTKEERATRRKRNISVFIGNCIVYADWDDDGQIDYEEFLRALHPKFNEGNITPRPLMSPSGSGVGIPPPQKSFIFEVSIGTGHSYNTHKNNNNNNGD